MTTGQARGTAIALQIDQLLLNTWRHDGCKLKALEVPRVAGRWILHVRIAHAVSHG